LMVAAQVILGHQWLRLVQQLIPGLEFSLAVSGRLPATMLGFLAAWL
jgi:hypothetical protein